MSLFDDASLAMIPSAYKDGKLYSIKPTDGSGDFTFTRGSNLAATRVDENGLIEKGRENLLLQSNQFDTTWGSANNTLVSGQSGYDGSNDAWLVTKIAAVYVPLTQSVFVSGVNTFSFYAKAGTATFVRTYIPSGNWITNFDFASGIATNASTLNGVVSYSMTDVGNGWFRCSGTYNGSITQVRIYNEWDETNATTYYLQDAQLEKGLVATDYIETTTTTAQAGILEDMPRLDYSGGASCPSLLLEPQRTNLITQSELFSDAAWAKNNLTVTSNAAISPDGNLNADSIVGDGTSGNHYILEQFTVVGTQDYTVSIFAKAGTNNFFQVNLGAAPFSSTNYCNFDLSSGIIGGYGGTSFNRFIEPFSNGWYRIGFTATALSSGSANLFPTLITSSTSVFLESNTLDTSIEIYGAQIEQGYPTSYIPTYGTSQTRSEESSTTASSDLISTQSFTMFFEHKALGISSTSWAYALEMADGSDEIEFYVNNGIGMNIYLGGNGGYIFGSSSNAGYGAGLTSKVALSYDGDKLSYFINGSLYDSATGISFSDVNTYLNLRGSRNIALKQSLVFPTALTDSECIALTTL